MVDVSHSCDTRTRSELQSIKTIMLPKLFHKQGLFCASHPWEVIVFTLTLTLCILSMGSTLNNNRFCVWSKNCATNDLNKNAGVVFMTITRCMAVLYIYHQFTNLRKLGSKYIIGIAGLFTVFSSCVFCSSVINFLQGDLTELNEALPFFFLLIDLPKASLLAQFALTSSNQEEVRDNIARGMALLGPTITLDTILETLVLGVGTLSGVKRLEVIGCFACLSVIVNYLVFMTFFPACLSLILEVSRDHDDTHPVWQLQKFTRALQEEEQKPNPVLQRVKLIMSAGLVLVHAHSRWPLLSSAHSSSESDVPDVNASYLDEDSTLGRWLTVSYSQAVMLILALALAVKYICDESRDNVPQMISNGLETRNVQDHSTNSQDRTTSNVSIRSSTIFSSNETFKNVDLQTKMTQTEDIHQRKGGAIDDSNLTCHRYIPVPEQSLRSLNECISVLKTVGPQDLTDEEIMLLVNSKQIAVHQLEKQLGKGNEERAVDIRRRIIAKALNMTDAVSKLPYTGYNYSKVTGACCENVIGYMPVPVGVAGPLLVNGREYYIPMATTEGCLVASTNRGCRVLTIQFHGKVDQFLQRSGGVTSFINADAMTRGPTVIFPSALRAGQAKQWLQSPENFQLLKSTFDSTSNFARLERLKTRVVGRNLYIRFEASTGDAMGMNMLTKGTETALKALQLKFPDMEIISLSGNYCTDKKAAAINWIDGRGKDVVSEAVIPGQIVREILKTSVSTLLDRNVRKNLVGSAVAGCIGGNNAQAANIVTAIYIATGQDPAQCVTSSNCMTLMESCGPNGEDLHISCSMPSLELGTVGGGTYLPPQAACLEMLGVRGSCSEEPGHHAKTLACIVAAAVLAGEISLMAALCEGNLVRSHMQHNRPQPAAHENVLEKKMSTCQDSMPT